MSNENLVKSSINYKRILIILIVVLVAITIIYQSRRFLDDSQFIWISVPTYAILPGILTGYSAILSIKLFKQKHFHAKAFLFFALGSAFWFIAEQIWQVYDHILQKDPFPSEADIFYVISYPFMIVFLFLLIRPIIKSISRNVWLFSIALSFSFLVPSVLAAYDDIQGDEVFVVTIALTYPILSSIVLILPIIGVLFLSKKGANFFWILILIGFIVFGISDTFFLFSELDKSYYDGHPVDLMFVYSFILLVFALHIRYKIIDSQESQNKEILFVENIQFETIRQFGIPLTVAIVCLVTIITLIHSFFIQMDENNSNQNLLFGVVSILVVFVIIVFIINKNLSRLVKMKTDELARERDNLENLVEEKTQQLLKSERLSAIGELSGRLAHDLRNPLSVMKMSVDLINQSSPDTKISDWKVIERLDLIKKSIDRISHQVDDVLGYVRNSPIKLTLVPLSELIENAIVKVNVPKNIKIEFNKNNLQIKCDPIKLEAVILNLIVNAIQAMPDGGKLEIKTFENKEDVILEFIDSGDGILNENLDKVFEPLFTTKQKGTGLGLASCKNIVEQHLGRISVKNNPTTFTVIIPKGLSVETSKVKK